MARMKKATAKKAAPKKVGKKPAPKKQASKEELTPVPTQQNPQPPMGTPPMGANGPMMRKGGKIKKMQGGGPAKDKYKNLGGEIGNPPFDKNSPVTYLPGRKATNVPSTQKAKPKKMMKAGGTIKAKNGKSFPDLNKDGKVTRADILKGRGVIAKKGATIKKAQSGTSVDRNTPSDISKMRKWYKDKNTPGKDRNTPAEVKKMRESYKSGEMTGKKAKSGASVKKCRYGCK